MLSGGVDYLAGTLIGVLIMVFILLQRLISRVSSGSASKGSVVIKKPLGAQPANSSGAAP